MSETNSGNSNLQSVEILWLIKSGIYSTAVEKIQKAKEQNVQLYVEPDLISIAYDHIIAVKREQRNYEEVINLFLEKFDLVHNTLSDRKPFFESLIRYLNEINDELSKYDWREIIRLLEWQNNYLKMVGKERELIGHLDLATGQFEKYEKRTKIDRDSEVEEFIQIVKTTFLKALPAEESLDYAAQIILNTNR